MGRTPRATDHGYRHAASGASDRDSLIALVSRATAMPDPGDVVEFDAGSLVAEAITEGAAYVGTRIRLQAGMGKVRQTVQIDLGVGDAVFPSPVRIEYPLTLGGEPVRLSAYPLEASIAEKFHAMVARDLRNSRMKDFCDLDPVEKPCLHPRITGRRHTIDLSAASDRIGHGHSASAD